MGNAGYIESAALTSGGDSAFGVRGFDSRKSLVKRGWPQLLFPFRFDVSVQQLPLPPACKFLSSLFPARTIRSEDK